MVEVRDAGYLSIGEVLGLLLEEFPDVTISKIRFLESQGLISPERTSSGYRKFFEEDVDLLRVILTEQRTNYLPLRVIKNRLASGEIDPTGEHLRPEGVDDTNGNGIDTAAAPQVDVAVEPDVTTEVPTESIRSHPAARHQPPAEPEQTVADEPALQSDPQTQAETQAEPQAEQAVPQPEPDPEPQPEPEREVDAAPADTASAEQAELASTQLLPSVLLDRAELCGMIGMTEGELTQLESFGIVAPNESGGTPLYGEDAVEIAKTSCEFLRAGVDARHLRNWRTSAEREASLYEQLVTPRFRQRNPEARAAALDELRRLDVLGAKLRQAMTRQALRHHFES